MGNPANDIDRCLGIGKRQNVVRSFVCGFFILSVVEVSFVRDRRCHTEWWLVGMESSCAFISFFFIFSCSESELSLADTLSFVGVISGLFDRGPGTGSPKGHRWGGRI